MNKFEIGIRSIDLAVDLTNEGKIHWSREVVKTVSGVNIWYSVCSSEDRLQWNSDDPDLCIDCRFISYRLRKTKKNIIGNSEKRRLLRR